MFEKFGSYFAIGAIGVDVVLGMHTWQLLRHHVVVSECVEQYLMIVFWCRKESVFEWQPNHVAVCLVWVDVLAMRVYPRNSRYAAVRVLVDGTKHVFVELESFTIVHERIDRSGDKRQEAFAKFAMWQTSLQVGAYGFLEDLGGEAMEKTRYRVFDISVEHKYVDTDSARVFSGCLFDAKT